VSRIVSQTEIRNVVYSKEKGIEIKVAGKEAYIKVLPKEITNPDGTKKLIYPDAPRELYVVCGDKTYSLILIPKDVPAETIILKNPAINIAINKEKAGRFESSTPYINTILKLIKDVYLGDMPDGYRIEELNQNMGRYKEVDVVLRRTYTGEAYKIKEYIIEAKQDISLDETQFLSFSQHSLAVSLVNPKLSKGQMTRLFVIEVASEN
jgi:conjugal transfer pilus assembly protein TraK